MTRTIVFAALAVTLLTTTAQAQYADTRPPLYPYAAQPAQSYAVEVAPGTYVIHRARNYPYVRCLNGCESSAPVAVRHVAPRAAVEEPRRRHARRAGHDVVNTTRIVREKPVVIEHERVVDDPPRVIERRHYVDDARPSAPAPHRRTARIETDFRPPHNAVKGKAGPRTIHAEAEVTILGPDRMSIRLFRSRGASAKAEAR